MQVKELIKKLNELEPTAEVFISIGDGKEVADVEQVGGDLESPKVWVTLK